MLYKAVPNLIIERLTLAFLTGVVIAASLPRTAQQYALHLLTGREHDALQYATMLQIGEMEQRAALEEQAQALGQLPPAPPDGFHVEVVEGYWLDWSQPVTLSQEWINHVSRYGDVQVWDNAHTCIGHIWQGRWYPLQQHPDVCQTGARAIAEQQHRQDDRPDPFSGK